jgi:RecA/RadA recombinase
VVPADSVSESTPFRSFAEEAFHQTPSWARLDRILRGNGAAIGLYGPRGSGKSWLMLNAVSRAARGKGMGLWFPCPGDYDTAAFLSSLSDNLASAVETRVIRNNFWSVFARRLQFALTLVIALPVIIAVVTYAIHGLNSKLTSATIFSSLPGWLWLIVGIAIGLLVAVFVGQIIQASTPSGRLAREATALRERIRFTTQLKLATEFGLNGGSRVTGSLKRSQERSLDERPTTIASLVFDFRMLAAMIVKSSGKPLVIGIDELDKIDDLDAVRKLLRDIKGIFEITGVYFLVSVSEEAATKLRLGPLQGSGRNEFNSSFYTVIEVPPLSAAEVADVLRDRGLPVDARRAEMLCLLGAGNWREILRLAESAAGSAGTDFELVTGTLRSETAALQREIIRVYGGGGATDRVTVDVWHALPGRDFISPEKFDVLSKTAIHNAWELGKSDATWQDDLQEPWRRILIRLFVMGRVVSPGHVAGTTGAFSAEAISDLRDVLVMAGQSTAVARLMLRARFSDDLDGQYKPGL